VGVSARERRLYPEIQRLDALTFWRHGADVMRRATVYFEEDLHKALRIKAVESDRSLSDLVNDAIRTALDEDLDDLNTIEERKIEKAVSYEVFLKELKSRGQI
jgi:hypothetical protein